MSTLLLRLAGPLQSWGTSSKFAYRFTSVQPSKSAVIGLLAAAQGRRRTDDIEDLLQLSFGVRCDQPGTMVRDFQTARALDESYSLPLTYRFYLGDAVFVAGVQGPDALIAGLADALRRPAFPLYLGRRSCPPGRPVLIRVSDLPLREALTRLEWQASAWYREGLGPGTAVELVRDAAEGEVSNEYASDVPITFDPHHRRFAQRAVVHEWCVPGELLSEGSGTDASPAQGGSTTAARGTVVGPPGPSGNRRGRARPITTHSPTDWWQPR